jgi:hypothetical protein
MSKWEEQKHMRREREKIERRNDEIRRLETGSLKRKQNGMERGGKKKKKNPTEKRKAQAAQREDKKKQPKITEFITGNHKMAEQPKKKRPRTEEKRKVTRNELLTEIMGITKMENIAKREG